ncbi:MAG: DNA replication and repair protein RecF [Clostridiales bacterium]|nr:DNA replication and repair protein RecF [Clostridiales bacterium]
MRIDKIILNNFRNYGRLDLDVGPSVNIVYGDNGEGKTNLIESICVGSCIVSHKTNKDSKLVKIGEDNYSVELIMTDDDGSEIMLKDVVQLVNDTPKRKMYCNNGAIDKISEYMGICNTVIFAPEDLNIIKGSPIERRKFLNLMISKVSPTYVNLIGNTNRLINQKNETLKNARFGNANIEANLDFWDISLSDLMAEMIIYRYRFIAILNDKASGYHSSISGNKEILKLKYSTISGCIELLERFLEDNSITDEFKSRGLNKANFEALKGILSSHIYNKLQTSRRYDIEKGIASVNIKKDDITILLNDKEARVYSSQGQQRSAALSLKLAELSIIKQFAGSTPILLLDDVFSELDVNRRVSLISSISDTQIFITCTDRGYIEKEISALIGDRSDVRYFEVKNGTIS